jgi:hypothetical protein
VPTTPNYAIPYLALTDAPDIAGLGEDGFTVVDTELARIDSDIADIQTDVSSILASYPRGIMAAPVSTGTNGTATGADTTEVRDAVLGNYVFTAVAGRRYRVRMHGLLANAAVADCRFSCRIRDGGASTPTAASTLLAEGQTWVGETISGGREQCIVEATFTASAGTHTLSAFTFSPDSVALTPISGAVARELYVEDIGAA